MYMIVYNIFSSSKELPYSIGLANICVLTLLAVKPKPCSLKQT